MHIIPLDIRYGVRMLLKKPVFSLIAIITLALGIGANAAIFSLVNTAVLRPLSVANGDRFVSLNNLEEGRLFPLFSYPNYKDFRDRNDSFSGLIAYRFAPLSLSYDGINERLWGYVVTGNYFDVLGVKAAAGRMVSENDDHTPGAHPVAVVSYEYWQKRFGKSQDVVGKTVIVNGRGYEIIGVAERGFRGTEIVAAPEMWFPMAMQAQIELGNNLLDKREVENIFVQGRLRDGMDRGRARESLKMIASQLEREFPEVNKGKSIAIAEPGLFGGTMRGAVLGFAGVLMMAVGLVLLLACINLANLLLARANERRREIAVQLALGASRFQLIRQLLSESLLLSSTGGLIGLVLAFWLLKLATAIRPPVDVPLSIDLHLDYRVIVFTALISLVAGLLFGLLPALQATGTDLISALKDEMHVGRLERSWLKNGLIVFQIALSLALLIGGGLMLRSLQHAQTVDLGFNPRNAIEITFDLRLQGYDNARGAEFQRTLLDRVRALPGVEAAAIADMVPVDLHFSRSAVFIEGRTPERIADAPRAMSNRITPGYFSAMSTRLLEGRDFTEQDNERAARVAIVNETFARRFWPGEDPIGKRFSLGGADRPVLEVVGVSENGKYAGLNEQPQPFVYRPIWQSYSGTSSLLVRSAIVPEKMIATVREELYRSDPQLPISTAKTMAEHMSLPLLPARVAAGLLGSFGLLALALAAIGLYGVMSYTVSQRTREVGIRIALGAQRLDVFKATIGQGMILTLIGVLLGVLASLGLARLMKGMLFGVGTTDPLTFVLIALLLTSVAFLACWIPARRAALIDPIAALRHD
jgi:macrolide transport system ATP-binding/permease protein